jgi:UDP-3-O-[3-hydroxymyristoyl] glucosamine N-acyltransferase
MSSSWKQYGGQSTLDSLNNITVNSLVTDYFTLRRYYVGDWDICGGLRVKDNAVIYSNQDICGNLIVGENISVIGEFTGLNNANFFGNLVVNNDFYLGGTAYFDVCANTFLSALNGGFGFNKYNPDAIIDISSDRVQTVFMQSSTTEVNNIYAQNAGEQGVTLSVDSSNVSLNFYFDSSMNKGNTAADAKIVYNGDGNMRFDVSNVLNVRPKMVLSNKIDALPYSDFDRITVYDTNTLAQPYMNYVYGDSRLKTGIGLTTVSQDNSSNIFLRMVSPEGKGALIGGGPFEGGQMASMGLIDTSANNFSNSYHPGLQIFSGDFDKNLKTSVAVNKYRVSKTSDSISNRYAMDINGPIKLIHQELLVGLDISLELTSIRYATGSSIGYAVGSPAVIGANPYQTYICKTYDRGYTWIAYRLLLASTGLPDTNGIEVLPITLRKIYPYSDTEVYIAGDAGYLYKSNNGGATWSRITYTVSVNFSIQDFIVDDNYSILITGDGNFLYANDRLINVIQIDNNLNKINFGISPSFAAGGKYPYYVFAGNGGVRSYTVGVGLGTKYQTSYNFNDVSVYYDGVLYHAVAVGQNGAISYLHGTDLNGTWSVSSTVITGNFNAVRVFDKDKAIAVGANGLIAYSKDTNFAVWNLISSNELNSMGNGNIISSLNLTDINVVDNSRFSICGLQQSYNNIQLQLGHSLIFQFYAPYFFNRTQNYVLEASGSVLLSGDLKINDNGNVFTNSASISLFPDTATAINIGNTAIGGNTFIKHNLDVTGNAYVSQKLTVNSYSFLNADVSMAAKLYVAGDASLSSNLFVGKDASFGAKLYVVSDASLSSNLFVGKDASFSGKLYTVGDASLSSNLFVGKDASFSGKLYTVGDASLSSNLFVGKDASLGQKLYVDGNASLNSNLYVRQDSNLGAKLFVLGDSFLNSNLFVGRDASLSSKLYVEANTTLNANLFVGKKMNVIGDVSFNSNLFVVKDVSMSSKLFVVGDTTINSNLSVGSRLRVNGKSQFESDVSINANLYVIDASLQNLQMRGTADSTGIGVGSLLTAGGASIAKSVNIGGNLFVNNIVDSVAGASSLFIGNSNASIVNVGVTNATSVINIGKSIGGGRGTNVDIYLGDSVTNSTVHILGNLLVPGSIIYENQTNLQIKNKTILLNDEAAAGTSASAGLYIRDNGSDSAGSILVNANRTGFTFKATNSNNMVNFDTENMTLPGGVSKGLITIVPTTNGDGSQFTIARSAVDISNINLLDVCLNARLLRNNAATLTQTNTQIVDTKVVSSGFYVGKTEANMITNTQLDISGNTILGRLGINTVTVNSGYTLDISGNTFTNGRIVQW